MKNVNPDLIVGATKVATGKTTATLMTLYADMNLNQADTNIHFVLLQNEQTPGDVMRSLMLRLDLAPVEAAEFLRKFSTRLHISNITSGRAEECAHWLKDLLKSAEGHHRIWVYADMHRAFKLGCTNGAGMVVPFTVETIDAMADPLNDKKVRFRVATMDTRLNAQE